MVAGVSAANVQVQRDGVDATQGVRWPTGISSSTVMNPDLVGEVRIERENELKPRRTAAEICQVQIFVNAVAHPPEDRKFQCVLCGRVEQAAPGIGWLLRKIGGPQNEIADARPLIETGKRGADGRLSVNGGVVAREHTRFMDKQPMVGIAVEPAIGPAGHHRTAATYIRRMRPRP